MRRCGFASAGSGAAAMSEAGACSGAPSAGRSAGAGGGAWAQRRGGQQPSTPAAAQRLSGRTCEAAQARRRPPCRPRSPRADAADDLARGVRVEALVDQRPEAGDQRAAERGDVEVHEHRGGARARRGRALPRCRAGRRERGGRGHHPRRRAPRERERQKLGAGERGERGRAHHERQRGTRSRQEQRVAHGASRRPGWRSAGTRRRAARERRPGWSSASATRGAHGFRAVAGRRRDYTNPARR